MSTIKTVMQYTSALSLALFLSACSGTAPINDASSSTAPSTKGDHTEITATPSTASVEPDASAKKGTASKEADDQMIKDDKPADKLFEEEKVGWEAVDKGKRKDHDDSKGLPWDIQPGYEVVGDKQLRIYFPSGSRKCIGHRVEVKETDKQVEITLIQGFLNESSDMVCTAEGTHRTMLVDLEKPLGDRKVVSAVPAEDN